MNITQFIGHVQDVLDDTGQKYPIPSIVRNCDIQMRGIFRTLVTSNKQYHNFTMGFIAAEGVQLMQNVWEYRLPSWVTAVTAVYIRPLEGDASKTNTFSVYRWTLPTPAALQNVIPKSTHGTMVRWTWEGMHTLRIWNSSIALDLIVMVAKLPPKMFKGAISTSHATGSRLYMPTSLVYGEVETEEGAYINADVQVTNTAVAISENLGVVRRCVYSNAHVLAAGVRVHEFTMDGAFTPTLPVGDTIETLIPMPAEHARYLVLKTAQACFQKKPGLDGLRAIADELREESEKFLIYATPPRDTRGPTFWRPRTTTLVPIDNNRRRY